jgi:anti-sigma regulatory factor (Ser/Thr protein kinase)
VTTTMPARPAHRAPAPRFTPAVPRDPAAPDHRWADRWPLRSYLELAALYTAPGCARAHARAVLWEWGADAGLAETLELLLSEMMTNAVKSVQEHGCPYPVRLWMLADGGSVLLLVWDATMPAPVPRVTTPDAEHGRGLTLVDALSRQWGYYHPAAQPGGEQPAGKAVWALVEPQAPAPAQFIP